MEVLIRNVPLQANEKLLRKFFESIMAKFSIQNFSCQKSKRNAFLIFHRAPDCLRFLERYGQITGANGRSVNGPHTEQLEVLGQPIYCMASHKSPDPYHLKCLEREFQQQQKKPSSGPLVVFDGKSTGSHVFDTTSLSCGVWSYEGSNLVFLSYKHWNESGSLTITSRKSVLRLHSGKQVEISHLDVENIAVTNELIPSMTYTMSMAPRFTETNPLARMLNTLSLSKRGSAKNLTVRQSHLGEGHEKLAATCLVYRITCRPLAFSQKLSNLGKSRGIPTPIFRSTQVRAPREKWHTEMEKLRNAFVRDYQNLPFAVLFQINRLALNGYLRPDRVLELFPIIDLMVSRSGIHVSVATLRKFAQQIPFAGPETEASDHSLQALAKILLDNEERSKKEEILFKQKYESLRM